MTQTQGVSTSIAAPAPPGLRERQKRERRTAIEAAARAVFHEKGFEGATTREIAARAGVSIGTLFAYAPDKRQLLAMVVRDELHALTERTFAGVAPGAPFLDQLESVLRARYAYWGADPELARDAIRETFVSAYLPGRSLEAGAPAAPPEYFLRRRVHELAERARARGALVPGADPELIARLVLDIYLSEHREWLAERKPRITPGVRRLRTVLALALAGVIPE